MQIWWPAASERWSRQAGRESAGGVGKYIVIPRVLILTSEKFAHYAPELKKKVRPS